MGLFEHFFTITGNKTLDALFEKYKHQMLPATLDGKVPVDDGYGHSWSNVFTVTITGTTHLQNGFDPQRVIPKLTLGEYVVLIPDVNNTYDRSAVMVFAKSGKQLGWIPKSHREKENLFRRLVEAYKVFAVVYDTKKDCSGNWKCDIKIATFGTPFDLSIVEKSRMEQQEKLDQSLKVQLEKAIAKNSLLKGAELNYLNIIKSIVTEIPSTSMAVEYITYADVDEYFAICIFNFNIIKLHLQGRKQYWLFPMPYAEYMRTFPDSPIPCEPPSKKEGNYHCRLLIASPQELMEHKDIIARRFLYGIRNSLTYEGAFPELEQNP